MKVNIFFCMVKIVIGLVMTDKYVHPIEICIKTLPSLFLYSPCPRGDKRGGRLQSSYVLPLLQYDARIELETAL